jgi:hypothetical protein
MDKKSGFGRFRDEQPDHISESLQTICWVKILKYFDSDPGSWMEKIRIGDGKIRIRDKTSRIRNTASNYYHPLLYLHVVYVAAIAHAHRFLHPVARQGDLIGRAALAEDAAA